MNSTDTTTDQGSRIIAGLEKAWAIIAGSDTDVPQDVVIITGSGVHGRSLRLGHHHAERWVEAEGEARRTEILISGECLRMGAAQVLQTLVHEAAHGRAHRRGVKDTSRGGRYHNKRFVREAEALGMEYAHETPHGTLGFSGVTLTDEGRERYAEAHAILVEVCQLGLDMPGEKAAASSSSTTVRAVCGCDRILRMSPSAFEAGEITCGSCGEAFEASDA
jgi:hypothetical protein